MKLTAVNSCNSNDFFYIKPSGDFRNATVFLGDNLLTRFEEGVFKEMLLQMANSSTRGVLLVDNSE